MVTLRQEYLLLQQDSDILAQRLTSRPKNFTLFSFLEKAAGDAGVKKNIKYMKPSASTGVCISTISYDITEDIVLSISICLFCKDW